MLGLEEMLEIKILYQQGYSKRKIAQKLKVSRNTVKRYLQLSDKEGLSYQNRPPVEGKLTAYKDYLGKRQQAAWPEWIPATVLHREITQQGYKGSLSLLREYMRSLKMPIPEEPLVRFETQPGKQLQVDWADFKRGGYRLSALVATLGYSRMSYVEFVDNQQLETLLNCLANAFDYFGGVTSQLLFDNMKTVVIKRNVYGKGYHRFQAKLWDFAKHYGFMPKLCQPYRARTKGKVERFIRYLRYSFYVPLQSLLASANLALDVNTANQEVKKWLASVANCRVHTDLQQKPMALFEQEKIALQPLPPAPYAGLANLRLTAPPLDYIRLPSMEVPAQHDLSLYQQFLTEMTGDYL